MENSLIPAILNNVQKNLPFKYLEPGVQFRFNENVNDGHLKLVLISKSLRLYETWINKPEDIVKAFSLMLPDFSLSFAYKISENPYSSGIVVNSFKVGDVFFYQIEYKQLKYWSDIVPEKLVIPAA